MKVQKDSFNIGAIRKGIIARYNYFKNNFTLIKSTYSAWALAPLH